MYDARLGTLEETEEHPRSKCNLVKSYYGGGKLVQRPFYGLMGTDVTHNVCSHRDESKSENDKAHSTVIWCHDIRT